MCVCHKSDYSSYSQGCKIMSAGHVDSTGEHTGFSWRGCPKQQLGLGKFSIGKRWHPIQLRRGTQRPYLLERSGCQCNTVMSPICFIHWVGVWVGILKTDGGAAAGATWRLTMPFSLRIYRFRRSPSLPSPVCSALPSASLQHSLLGCRFMTLAPCCFPWSKKQNGLCLNRVTTSLLLLVRSHHCARPATPGPEGCALLPQGDTPVTSSCCVEPIPLSLSDHIKLDKADQSQAFLPESAVSSTWERHKHAQLRSFSS